MQIDVAIIGAGIAGLTCAQVLHQAGYRVAIFEKSRGVGGRLSTRRLHDVRADHGTCYLSPRGDLFQAFIQALVAQEVVQVWTDRIDEIGQNGTLHTPEERSPRYVAPDGMNAIAKFLTPGLDIQFNQRVASLNLDPSQSWQLTLESTNSSDGRAKTETRTAKAVLLTAPSPQVLELVTPLVGSAVAPESVQQLRAVEFKPCIAVMAGYHTECLEQWQAQYGEVKAIALQHSDIAWIGLDSSKRRTASQPVFVVQSTADFAQQYLDAQDLMPAGTALLQSVASMLTPWLAHPDWLQAHRWRYAFASRPLATKYWVGNAIVPLVGAGDWCGGMRVESAFLSGLEAAQYLNHQLSDRPLTIAQFWQACEQTIN
ncbi:MAG: FAD-dependent oxidoreductase [Leptolyngbyaceae cyanobacterium bins.302]|nr:FAD-dependent oxidoreductase [Leptolyngbyaceae cyanobacterium bins.302]